MPFIRQTTKRSPEATRMLFSIIMMAAVQQNHVHAGDLLGVADEFDAILTEKPWAIEPRSMQEILDWVNMRLKNTPVEQMPLWYRQALGVSN